jgi:hypothetical protein
MCWQDQRLCAFFAMRITRRISLFRSWASRITPGVRGCVKVAEETAIKAVRMSILSYRSQLCPFVAVIDPRMI